MDGASKSVQNFRTQESEQRKTGMWNGRESLILCVCMCVGVETCRFSQYKCKYVRAPRRGEEHGIHHFYLTLKFKTHFSILMRQTIQQRSAECFSQVFFLCSFLSWLFSFRCASFFDTVRLYSIVLHFFFHFLLFRLIEPTIYIESNEDVMKFLALHFGTIENNKVCWRARAVCWCFFSLPLFPLVCFFISLVRSFVCFFSTWFFTLDRFNLIGFGFCV